MEELKDIKLTSGDVVTVKNKKTNKIIAVMIGTINKSSKASTFCGKNDEIIKIERSYYQTIYEAPKPILDKEEKKYLEAVIRPFRDDVEYIEKIHNDIYGQYIKIRVTNFQLREEDISLPYFEENTMYKGMELDKEYTLEELGLFE